MCTKQSNIKNLLDELEHDAEAYVICRRGRYNSPPRGAISVCRQKANESLSDSGMRKKLWKILLAKSTNITQVFITWCLKGLRGVEKIGQTAQIHSFMAASFQREPWEKTEEVMASRRSAHITRKIYCWRSVLIFYNIAMHQSFRAW